MFQSRTEIPIEQTWDLSALYPDDAAWEQAAATLSDLRATMAAFAGHLEQDATTLATALATYAQLQSLTERLWTYAARHRDEAMTSATYQALFDRAQGWRAESEAASAFLRPELLQFESARLEQFMQERAELCAYTAFFADVRRDAPHVLSVAEERLLAQMSDLAAAPRSIYMLLTDADLTFGSMLDENDQPVTLTANLYWQWQRSPNRRVRRESFERYYATYTAHQHTCAGLLAAHLKQNILYARARHHSSALAAALHFNNVPVEVYTNLIDTVRAHTAPLQRYLTLRQQVMGVDSLHIYDLGAPLLETATTTLSFESALELVLAALAPLGEQYVADLRAGLSSRWLDVHASPNKRRGAHSAGSYGTYPYTMMNFDGTLMSAFTLAHELGHAMHSFYTWRAQPYVYAYPSDFTGEVAAIVHEVLLTHHVLEQTDDPHLRLALLQMQLDSFRGAVYRQTLFAEFEQRIYTMVESGEALNAERISVLYADLYRDYYGAGLVSDPAIALEWAALPHFYFDFYVYQYATGLAAATALGSQIIAQGAPAAERYLRFLALGSSVPPIEALQVAGVDMSTALPIEQALEIFAQRVSALEAALTLESKGD